MTKGNNINHAWEKPECVDCKLYFCCSYQKPLRPYDELGFYIDKCPDFINCRSEKK